MSDKVDPECIFCKIASQQVPTKFIYEDPLIVAFADLHPKAETHVLLVPKLHIVNLFDTNAEHAKVIGHMANSLTLVAQKLGLSGFRTIINTGKEGSQEIMHLHMHLLHGKLKGF